MMVFTHGQTRSAGKQPTDCLPAVPPRPLPLAQVEAPALFPPTFLYTLSWEDPRADEPFLKAGRRGEGYTRGMRGGDRWRQPAATLEWPSKRQSLGPPASLPSVPPSRAPHPLHQINSDDVCLTLTSGGCNSLHLCINGARKVRARAWHCCTPGLLALLAPGSPAGGPASHPQQQTTLPPLPSRHP